MKTFCQRIVGVYLGFVLSSSVALGSAIGFEDSWNLHLENQPDSLHWQFGYAFKSWLGLSGVYIYENMDPSRENEHRYGLLKSTYLLKRWNELESQGNIYLMGGAGGHWAEPSNKSKAAWIGGIEGDWESRKYYTSGKIMYLDSQSESKSMMYQARVGIAPYLTKFENLHTWAILQVQYLPDSATDKVRVSPMLRFYIENILWEMAVSTNGTWTFNAMVHL